MSVVPWRSRAEWIVVANLLCSERLEMLTEALSWIQVWSFRVQKLPMAVSITEWLYRPYIADLSARINVSNEGDSSALSNILMMYSCGIVRFVNYVNELGQKGNSVQPVHFSVQKLGIPKWIVELRHKATHQELPSLDQCQWATEFCRKWLLKHYWQAEGQPSEPSAVTLKCPTDDDSIEQRLQNAFQNFLNLREKVLCEHQQNRVETTEKIRWQQRQDKCLKRLEKLLSCNREAFLLHLLNSDNFLLTAEQICDQRISIEALQYGVPEPWITNWEPIFNLIFDHHCHAHLIALLVNKVSFSSELDRIQLLGWLLLALQKVSTERLTFDWNCVIAQLMFRPQCVPWSFIERYDKEYTMVPYLFDLTFSVSALASPLLDADKLEKLFNLYNLSVGSTISCTTDDYVLQSIQNVEHEDPVVGNDSDSLWNVAHSAVEWDRLPVGCVLNGCSRDDDRSLDL